MSQLIENTGYSTGSWEIFGIVWYSGVEDENMKVGLIGCGLVGERCEGFIC